MLPVQGYRSLTRLILPRLPARCYGRNFNGQWRGLASDSVRPVVQDTQPSKPYRALFFGTDHFSCTVLKEMIKVPVLDVLTVGDHCYGKGRTQLYESPLKLLAADLGLHTHFLAPDDKKMRAWQLPPPSDSTADRPTTFDIGLVASFGSFIPRRIITQFPLGLINVHPSLLPKYRGASPLQTALLHRDTETGVTIQELHPRTIDAGHILMQEKLSISPDDNYHSLMLRTGRLGGDMVQRFLQDVESHRATPAPKASAAASRIRWAEQSAAEVDAVHRAFGTLHPLHTFFGRGKRQYKVVLRDFHFKQTDQSELMERDPTAAEGGRIDVCNETVNGPALAVTLGGGGCIQITSLYIQGHGDLTAEAFIDKFKLSSGTDRFL
ncbi:Methionyl-tRNA formyltransferase [Tieghemiomyces parasiticus]|uniref:methionyl-tRNA formyltransferase n=1 Tax=Tieghemiomyces parasiticus TaxID=78921 RepID=A0A9W8E0F1_9FUNG|nr:Methionyl-tRNA formyltransferase [Tieghemiomyces parasiticus]